MPGIWAEAHAATAQRSRDHRPEGLKAGGPEVAPSGTPGFDCGRLGSRCVQMFKLLWHMWPIDLTLSWAVFGSSLELSIRRRAEGGDWWRNWLKGLGTRTEREFPDGGQKPQDFLHEAGRCERSDGG
jgi:hypothetical protein